MIFSWCDAKRSVLISRDSTYNPNKLLVSFFFRRRLLASVEMDVDQVKNTYPYAAAVEIGHQPDSQIFGQRRDRLNLTFDSVCKKNIAPPEAVGELVVSYGISRAGYAEVKGYFDVDSEQVKKLHINLISINPDTKVGWTEEFIVDRFDLGLHVEFSSALSRGLVH